MKLNSLFKIEHNFHINQMSVKTKGIDQMHRYWNSLEREGECCRWLSVGKSIANSILRSCRNKHNRGKHSESSKLHGYIIRASFNTTQKLVVSSVHHQAGAPGRGTRQGHQRTLRRPQNYSTQTLRKITSAQFILAWLTETNNVFP